MGFQLKFESEEKKREAEAQIEQAKRFEEAEAIALDMNIINSAMIQTIPQPMGFHSLMLALESDTFIVPRFQRAYRWNNEQVEQLAISLVRGMPIPPIYGYRNKKNQIVILDGQQRLISLYLYYIGKCLKKRKNGSINTKKLTNRKNDESFCETIEKLGLESKNYSMTYFDVNTEKENKVDISYSHLSEEARRVIDWAQISIILIQVDTEKYKERVMHKIFANLNKGGIPLSAQELRNGIYTCEFYEMLHEINETNSKWRSIYGGKKEKDENKESKDVELLLKLCAYRKNVCLKNGTLTLQNYKGKINILLDEFSEQSMEFKQDEIDEYRDSLLQFLECVQDIDTKTRETLLPCLFVVAEQKDFQLIITKELCKKITSSDEYKETNKSGTSSKADIEKRLRYVYEQL